VFHYVDDGDDDGDDDDDDGDGVCVNRCLTAMTTDHVDAFSVSHRRRRCANDVASSANDI